MRDGRTGRWASAPSRSPSSSPGHSSFAGLSRRPRSRSAAGDGGGAAGICLAYSVEELANRDFAFDGTVTAIDGDQATFTVNESFIGDMSGSVTLTAPVSSEDISFEGGTELVQGERYLVSGDDGIVWGCGFTQPYSETLAAEWATAG